MMEDDRAKKQGGKNKIINRFGWLGLLAVTVLTKLKSILPLLKLGKFGGTIISMFVSIGAYALLFPWSFAIGLVVMIFIHEMGHVWAAKIKKVPVSAPAFIPFVGALITMKRQPSGAETEAFIAFGGPLLGTLGAVITYLLGVWTGEQIFYVVATIGFFINLVNLIPIHPLDGGRIVTAITRWLWVLGLIGGLAFIIYLRSVIFTLIYVLFVWELWSAYRNKKKSNGKWMKKVRLSATVAEDLFQKAGTFIPGIEHQRELRFVQFCDLETKKHIAHIVYPGVGVIAKLEDPEIVEGQIERVKLLNTTPKSALSYSVEMKFEIYYNPATERMGSMHQDKAYFDVKPAVRWAYGVSYLSLILFLIYMLMLVPDISV
ncbi:site-2 protease family protein [Hazenella sp. IB182357]|uniref:Site-2 protease family protein n=1 Tax=Polycladospora coralii TaxID=2771432 RepID=A0A926RUD0_9BACL|nr:site-2 protease family protein [Polycladospora coralii]MBD1372407.1 site-2 protease family protein [Polycladospora coralii]